MRDKSGALQPGGDPAGRCRLGREGFHACVPGARRVGRGAVLLELGADAAEEVAGVVEGELELVAGQLAEMPVE